MKKNLNQIIALLLGIIITSCSQTKDLEQVIEKKLPTKQDSSVNASRNTRAIGNISITKIETNIIPKKNVGYSVGLDYEASNTINIYGSGFGTTRGKVKFTNYPNEYGILGIKTWSDKLVQLSASATLIASPRKDLKLYFEDGKGNGQSNPFPSVVPFIFNREYSTATHFCSMKRGVKGLQMQSKGEEYKNLTGTINTSYKPAANDLLVWTTTPVHQAFIESVSSTRTEGADKVFEITLSELNETTGKVANPVITIRVRNGVIIDSYKSSLRNTPATNYYRK